MSFQSFSSGENFPVASFFLSSRVRPLILALYRFARTTDDLIDDPNVTSDEKERLLTQIESELTEGPNALPESLHSCARELIQAFRWDAQGKIYPEWTDLLRYCRFSAASVGRFYLRLHGEDLTLTQAPADALCAALQILDHLQDHQEDWQQRGRLYLPASWVEEERDTGGFERVAAHSLDGIDELIDKARPLPALVKDKRLGLEIALCLSLSRALARLLRRNSAARLSSWRKMVCLIQAPFLYLASRLNPLGSSFYWPMRLFLTKKRRWAAFALYRYCRALDDIADGLGDDADKLDSLKQWRQALDNPTQADCSLQRVLHPVMLAQEIFALDRFDLQAMIDGMEKDVTGPIIAPTLAELEAYCWDVAGSVGSSLLKIFGTRHPQAQDLARILGEALQFTNILRDIESDARLGRCYVPREALIEADIPHDLPVRAIIRHPLFPKARSWLADLAAERFTQAELLIRTMNDRTLRPATIMAGIYRQMLTGLTKTWQRPISVTNRPKSAVPPWKSRAKNFRLFGKAGV